MSASPTASALRSRKNESAKKSNGEELNLLLNKNSGENFGKFQLKNGEKFDEIDHDFLKPTEIHRPLDWRHWTLFFLFIFLSYSFTFWCDSRLPDPISLEDAKSGQFVEERARNFLIELTSFGPRPSGRK